MESLHAQARAQALAQQEALLNSVAAGLLVLDSAGRVQLVNRAFVDLFGVKDDVRGKTILEAIRSHELVELFERVCSDARAADAHVAAQVGVLDTEFHHAGPPERWFTVNAGAIIGPDGQVQGAVMVFHDVTRLRRLERAREEFVANVSHELRTPLSHIKGYVETLLAGAKDDPVHSVRFLDAIARNTTRLELLIQDLLAISELESGRVQLHLQPVPLQQFVEEVFSGFRERAAARGVTLLNAVPELVANADPERLQQVFGNLLDNAIKYGRENGTVTVRARLLASGEVEVAVQDDGPGIPAEALDRVFERFYRVDKARSRAHGGTGLGLAIVKHIVQAHGGKVWAESELGKGATFYFTLPCVASTNVTKGRSN
ncbi:MAG: ATP-binding protein [Verrucomicrobiales bacterium]|nr:ATP-binding protein [Verrucomicrobiales bacterium]